MQQQLPTDGKLRKACFYFIDGAFCFTDESQSTNLDLFNGDKMKDVTEKI